MMVFHLLLLRGVYAVVRKYIKFCIETVTVITQIRMFPNQEPWITSKLKSLPRSRNIALIKDCTVQLELNCKGAPLKSRCTMRGYMNTTCLTVAGPGPLQTNQPIKKIIN